jgi:hypothetical protein
MFQGILRYLGLDRESKRVRAETLQNLSRARDELDELQSRLKEASKISIRGQKALNKTLSEGDISGKRAARI